MRNAPWTAQRRPDLRVTLALRMHAGRLLSLVQAKAKRALRPTWIPHCFAAAMPATIHSLICSRSNSAICDSTPNTNFPAGVVRSTPRHHGHDKGVATAVVSNRIRVMRIYEV
jgi:hypothetical protein